MKVARPFQGVGLLLHKHGLEPPMELSVAIRESHKDGKVTREVRYFFSSMPVGVQRSAQSVRGHWSIENTLHWCLGFTFREDESRLQNRQPSNNLAWLRRFALNQIKDKESIAMRRRKAGWNLD